MGYEQLMYKIMGSFSRTDALADKITVLSKRLIFRRAKDIIDVYALSHCVVIQSSEIFDVMYANPHRELGAFHELCHLAEDVAHAYDALKGIEGKPPFSEVYDYVMKFIAPFAKHDRHPRVWDSATQEWHVI